MSPVLTQQPPRPTRQRQEVLRGLCEAAGRLAIGLEDLTVTEYMRVRGKNPHAQLPSLGSIRRAFGSFDDATRALRRERVSGLAA